MGGTLFVYTDASIPDQPKAEPGEAPRRQQANDAFVAWCGWHDLYSPISRADKPTFVGEAYIGKAGIQRAEFSAAIYGLSAAFAYVAPLADHRKPGRAVLRVDSAPVERLLNQSGGAYILRPYLVAAQTLVALLDQRGIAVTIERVREQADKLMKAVDGRTKQAIRVAKRTGDWPAPADSDIPF